MGCYLREIHTKHNGMQNKLKMLKYYIYYVLVYQIGMCLERVAEISSPEFSSPEFSSRNFRRSEFSSPEMTFDGIEFIYEFM